MEIKMNIKLKEVLNTNKVSEITGIPEDTVFEALHKSSFKSLGTREKIRLMNVLTEILSKVKKLAIDVIEKENE